MQRQLSDAFEFCLDADNDPLNQLSANQRYLIYHSGRNQLGTMDPIQSTIHFDHVNPNLPGENRTCYSIGSSKKYQKKVANDPILREYTKAYKRTFPRYKNKEMSQSAFENRVRQAKVMRKEAMNHHTSCNNSKAGWAINKDIMYRFVKVYMHIHMDMQPYFKESLL